jgi:hypothetical protein
MKAAENELLRKLRAKERFLVRRYVKLTDQYIAMKDAFASVDKQQAAKFPKPLGLLDLADYM